MLLETHTGVNLGFTLDLRLVSGWTLNSKITDRVYGWPNVPIYDFRLWRDAGSGKACVAG
jgi:hypothetical protein